MEDAKARYEVYEFPMSKAKLSACRMLMVDVVIDRKGFIQQDPPWFQRVDERGEQWAIQVKEDENDIVRVMSEVRLLLRQFQVERS
jgi:hypothetical protein